MEGWKGERGPERQGRGGIGRREKGEGTSRGAFQQMKIYDYTQQLYKYVYILGDLQHLSGMSVTVAFEASN